MAIQQNWAGNYTYNAARLHYPRTVAQIQELAAGCDTLKALGSRHSFNEIADSPGDLISLERLDRVVTFDRERHTVTVDGGIRYGELCQQLYQAGYALPNLASLPHISIAGACATATHGSGGDLGNLATSVSALEIVTADGSLLNLSREHDGELFAGAVVSLGALGVVTKLTLDLIPAFTMRQNVYEDLPLARLEDYFDSIAGCGYSVSFFTDWHSGVFSQVWVKRRVVDGADIEVAPELLGATLATRQRHPIDGCPPERCTPQLGVPGPWHERLPHFRMDYTPSSGEELQSEYLIPRQNAYAALSTIDSLREQVAPLLQISEVRTVAADDLWLSPCYQQPCIAIHFTWKKNWPAVRALLPAIEEQLAPLAARPHWGKLFTVPPQQVQALYPKLPDFQRLLQTYDPRGKFRNSFVDRYILGSA